MKMDQRQNSKAIRKEKFNSQNLAAGKRRLPIILDVFFDAAVKGISIAAFCATKFTSK